MSSSVARADGSAVLAVADTSIGIPGSGLGLPIVGKIVANHHADMSIESAQNQGTKVTVRIPLSVGGQDAGDPGLFALLPPPGPICSTIAELAHGVDRQSGDRK